MALTAVLAVVVVTVDQLTKTLAVDHLSQHSVHLVGPFRFELSYNSGVAFSLGSGFTVPIILIAAVLIVSVAWFGRGVPSTSAAVAVGLILGGAVGNLADRVIRAHHGAVVDFIYSGFWPTFNVADSCVVCGSILLAIAIWRSGRSPAEAADAPAGDDQGLGVL
jgi:signal peptidase II